MTAKTWLKRSLGKVFPVDLLEQLTEYSIGEKVFPLDPASEIRMPGKGWEEVVNRGRKELWRRAFDRIGSDILLLEFGVFRGESLREFVTINTAPRSLFYGFDSFEGLPEDWRTTKAGHFSTDGEMPQIEDTRVRLVKGWFNRSLPPLLDQIEAEAGDRAVVVHLDADLYSSTLYALNRISERIPSFYFIFDEFAGHEARALHNFRQATGAEVEFWDHVNWNGLPAAVSGRLSLTR